MKHPTQAILALHAGGDLGLIARWRTSRHVAKCEYCREEVAAFEDLREALPELAEIPETQWNQLAAEMKANIRLGLAAGECVRPAERPLRESRLFVGPRAAVAVFSMAALLIAGIVLQKPVPVAAEDRTVLQTTHNGIQVGANGSSFGLINPGAKDMIISVGAQGSMGASYVDPETGYVTKISVYAE